MTPANDDTIREQLSAWMDGELPVDEARFLERRLAADPELRRHYERLQLASACLKRQPWRPMRPGLAAGIGDALAQPSPGTEARKSRPWHWAVAASVAALALFIAPGLWKEEGKAPAMAVAQPPTANLLPTPASADLVAAPTALAMQSPDTAAPPALLAEQPPLVATAAEAPRTESPLSLDSQSPADFPLVEAALQKSWPRSPLATGSDPAMEAYLVRHNQMLASDGLGGFVPYVDVVASDRDADAVEPGAAGGAEGQ